MVNHFSSSKYLLRHGGIGIGSRSEPCCRHPSKIPAAWLRLQRMRRRESLTMTRKRKAAGRGLACGNFVRSRRCDEKHQDGAGLGIGSTPQFRPNLRVLARHDTTRHGSALNPRYGYCAPGFVSKHPAHAMPPRPLQVGGGRRASVYSVHYTARTGTDTYCTA